MLQGGLCLLSLEVRVDRKEWSEQLQDRQPGGAVSGDKCWLSREFAFSSLP
jgi:hypothetical protein